MSFAKKVIVAIDFTNEIKNLYSDMKEMSFLGNSEIHFVHVANTVTYSFVFSDMPLVYPVEDDRREIEKNTIENLQKLASKVLPTGFSGKASHHCFFSENPKQTFVDYANEKNADLIIIAARERRGIFESSFAHYVEKHTKSNVLLVKHH